jgi:hypothetical protein
MRLQYDPVVSGETFVVTYKAPDDRLRCWHVLTFLANQETTSHVIGAPDELKDAFFDDTPASCATTRRRLSVTPGRCCATAESSGSSFGDNTYCTALLWISIAPVNGL